MHSADVVFRCFPRPAVCGWPAGSLRSFHCYPAEEAGTLQERRSPVRGQIGSEIGPDSAAGALLLALHRQLGMGAVNIISTPKAEND
jgi:hypothetical protein